MAKIVLLIEDKEEGKLDIQFTSNRPLPEKYEDWTLAETFVAKLHDTIDFILREQTNETNVSGNA
jgi:hypothetical protein